MKNFQQSALFHMGTDSNFVSTVFDALSSNFSKVDANEAYQNARTEFFNLPIDERKRLGKTFDFNQEKAIRSLIK